MTLPVKGAVEILQNTSLKFYSVNMRTNGLIALRISRLTIAF